MDSVNVVHLGCFVANEYTAYYVKGQPHCMHWWAILLECCLPFVDFKGSREVLEYLVNTVPPLWSHKKKRTNRQHDVGKPGTKLLVLEDVTHSPPQHEGCLWIIIESFGRLRTRLSAPTLYLWKMWCRECAYRCEWSFGTTSKNEVVFCDRKFWVFTYLSKCTHSLSVKDVVSRMRIPLWVKFRNH